LSSHVSFDNRAYTYFYDNETLSGNDVTLFGDPVASLKGNVVTLAPGAAKVPGVPGYTKSNKYRV
jgi:iron complex outermembrane receptor protein